MKQPVRITAEAVTFQEMKLRMDLHDIFRMDSPQK